MSKKILASILVFALFIFGIHFTGYADEPLSVTAPSALLMDFDTGKVLYEKNSHEKRACASITKVMTLCLIFEAIDAGKIDYDTIVTTTPAAAAAGGSDIWLVEGEQMSVNDLIKAIVVASANDAAVAVAEHLCGSEKAFVEQMNKKAQELGMKDTLFKNCSGLDEEGHLTSAYDVALMSRELMKHEEIFNYTSIWLDYLRDGATQIVNTNKLLKTYDGITGLKTGTTSQAGACISATAKRDGMSLISVILGAENTSDRFNDAASLLNYGFANYTSVEPPTPDDSTGYVNVSKGMCDTAAVKPEIKGKLLMEKGLQDSIISEIRLKDEVEAPVEKGQEVGRVTFKCGDTVLGEYKIVSLENIERINFSGVFGLMLSSFLSQ